MNLAQIRYIVTGNMPYDTGFMFLAGAKFFENEHFQMVKYDCERVPYIIYNEEGYTHWITHKFIDKNQGFIKDKTVGDLLRHEEYAESGLKAPFLKYEDRAKRRASTNMIKQGALVKIRGEI